MWVCEVQQICMTNKSNRDKMVHPGLKNKAAIKSKVYKKERNPSIRPCSVKCVFVSRPAKNV